MFWLKSSFGKIAITYLQKIRIVLANFRIYHRSAVVIELLSTRIFHINTMLDVLLSKCHKSVSSAHRTNQIMGSVIYQYFTNLAGSVGGANSKRWVNHFWGSSDGFAWIVICDLRLFIKVYVYAISRFIHPYCNSCLYLSLSIFLSLIGGFYDGSAIECQSTDGVRSIKLHE